MPDIMKLGPVSIDPVALASQGCAVLGIRDSGKTYTATWLAEQYHDAGVPFVTFDPIGVWRFLRVPGKGKGYPIVVAGGAEGDLPLTVAGAPEIVRAAMRSGVSLVLDLFDLHLTKSDWRKIVMSCVNVLLHENRQYGLRHVFIEEAAEFIPQRDMDGQVYAAVERLARMGGNCRLGYTLINQRSQEVSKAVLELCEHVFLHRQRGKNALDNVDKWLNVAGAATRSKIMETLPGLPQGETWAWLGGDHPRPPFLFKVPVKNSYHPDRRAMRGEAEIIQKKAVDVGSFVEAMRTTLVRVEEEAKANDPKALRAEIERLKKAATIPVPDKAAMEAARYGGYLEGIAAGRGHIRGVFQEALAHLTGVGAEIERLCNLAADQAAANNKASNNSSPPGPPQTANSRRESVGGPTSPGASAATSTLPPRTPSPVASGDGALKPALQRALNAIGWWDNIGISPVERGRAALVAGLSPRASTFGVYVAELAKLELVHSPEPGKVALTAAGRKAAATTAAGTAAELRDIARGLLKPQEQRAFDVVYSAWPKEIHRHKVAEALNLSPTASTTGVYLAAVAAYGIIETGSPGHVRAADWLFP